MNVAIVDDIVVLVVTAVLYSCNTGQAANVHVAARSKPYVSFELRT